MKKSVLIAICLFSNMLFAHTINYDKIILHHWNIEKENKVVDGTFYMFKNGDIYIEDASSKVVHFPLASFSKEDQAFALSKNKWVEDLNKSTGSFDKSKIQEQTFFDTKFWITALIITFLSFFIFFILEKQKRKFVLPILLVGFISILFSFTNKRIGRQMMSTTNPLSVDSAFTPFIPNVHTYWDANYFYVESQGIPLHQMMVGISNHGWQRQVPIPQCYVGTNAWPIPLNPVMAASPIPVDSIHFTRGAIAIAANGVPIFNVHTNTGVDSYLDGQLDNFGGHCGRGDDYHYHIAPTHLYSITSPTLPCAYALDGFAVYGSLEPDGSPMGTLDANHGHFGTSGVYHYHGTATAPYMIANMAGQVTEDGTHQLIPQAVAHPVRPGQNPLPGALITGCTPNPAGNGYTLTYTLAGLTDSIVYSWTLAGIYTFDFHTPTTDTVRTYTGFTQCNVPTSVKEVNTFDNSLVVYPNPTQESFSIKLNNSISEKDILNISIYSLKGELIYKSAYNKQNIDIRNLSKGTYIIDMELIKGNITKKLMVQ